MARGVYWKLEFSVAPVNVGCPKGEDRRSHELGPTISDVSEGSEVVVSPPLRVGACPKPYRQNEFTCDNEMRKVRLGSEEGKGAWCTVT
jgi:hypothetical protein